jgi:hypothetical protein
LSGAQSTRSGPSLVREGAERYLLLTIVAFVVAVVGTRWYLEATGYPQFGGGELHIAHMLWGGLLLIIAALLPLIVAAGWALTISAILTGAGTGLFIDEVGKFITASNDYFYPLAAPLIYGLLLVLILVFVLVRRRPGGGPAVERPAHISRWEDRHLPRRRYRRLLVAGLLLVGIGWVLSLVLFALVDPQTVRDLIEQAVNLPGDRVERPTEPVFYVLEAGILGAAGILLLAGAVLLGTGRERIGTLIATVGLLIALTAGAIVSLYVEQVSAILTTLIDAGLLFAIVHYRNRFFSDAGAVTSPDAAFEATGTA